MNGDPNPSQSRSAEDDFDKIAENVSKGHVVLFLGAGVHASKPGQPPDQRRPLFAGALAEALARETRWAERFPDNPPKQHFQRVTLDYELNIILDEQRKEWEQKGKVQGLKEEAINLRRRGRERLANAVQQAVNDGKTPSPALRALAFTRETTDFLRSRRNLTTRCTQLRRTFTKE